MTTPESRRSTGRRPTSADVAARAGVSRATVSYVLNRSTRHSIPEATRERVLAAAAALGYTPHAAASALRRGDSGIVLLIVGEVPFSENLDTMVSVMTAGVSAIGRSLVLWRASAGQPLAGVLAHVSPVVALVTMPLVPADAAALAAAGVQVLDPGMSTADELHAREARVGAVQVQHLASRGHRRIGLVTSSDPSLVSFATGRCEGALRAAHDLGLPEPLRAEVPDVTTTHLPALQETLAAWRALPEPVTAVCAYNDIYAAMVERAALDVGLAVPHDLSLVGVDDDHVAPFLAVPLTTVRYDFAAYAEHLMDRVRALLDGLPGPRRAGTVPVDVVERSSVATLG